MIRESIVRGIYRVYKEIWILKLEKYSKRRVSQKMNTTVKLCIYEKNYHQLHS